MRLGYTNVIRYPDGWYGWVADHSKKLETVALTFETFFPDTELSILGGAKDKERLGVEESARKVRLQDLRFNYYLVLLVNDNRLESEQAARTFEKVRKELECCTPDVLFVAIGLGMNKRAVKRSASETVASYPFFADPLEEIADDFGRYPLPTVVMFKKTESGLISVFSFSDIKSDPVPLLKQINSSLSGRHGQKCTIR